MQLLIKQNGLSWMKNLIVCIFIGMQDFLCQHQSSNAIYKSKCMSHTSLFSAILLVECKNNILQWIKHTPKSLRMDQIRYLIFILSTFAFEFWWQIVHGPRKTYLSSWYKNTLLLANKYLIIFTPTDKENIFYAITKFPPKFFIYIIHIRFHLSYRLICLTLNQWNQSDTHAHKRELCIARPLLSAGFETNRYQIQFHKSHITHIRSKKRPINSLGARADTYIFRGGGYVESHSSGSRCRCVTALRAECRRSTLKITNIHCRVSRALGVHILKSRSPDLFVICVLSYFFFFSRLMLIGFTHCATGRLKKIYKYMNCKPLF